MVDVSKQAYYFTALGVWAAICVIWLLSLARVKSQEVRQKKMKRLTVWLAIAVLEACAVALEGKTGWLILFGLAALFALGEIVRTSKQWLAMTGTCLIVFMAQYRLGLPGALIFFLGSTLLFLLPYRDGARTAAAGAIAACYVAPLGDLLATGNFSEKNAFLGIVLVMVHVCDIASGLTGKLGGVHPFPRLSPNKTVFGFLGGLVGALACGFLIAYFTKTSWGLLSGLAVLVWFAGATGDLVGSKFKRIFAIKDFGTILGPHGGVGDRIDSIAPVLCLAFILETIL